LPAVADIIAVYEAEMARLDHAAAARALVALEDPAFLNQTDWEAICGFLKQHNLDARLELITKRYIRAAPAASPWPYLVLVPLVVKSGRIAEAGALLKDYRSHFGDLPEFRWVYANLLYDTEDYAGCLELARAQLREDPAQIGYAVMEIRALAGLRQTLAAKTAMKKLAQVIGPNSPNWQWFLYIALELEDPAFAWMAHNKILDLVESGTAPVTAPMAQAFKHAGYDASIPRIIQTARVENYTELQDLADLFQAALHYGNGKVAAEFGRAVLARDPDHKLRPQIDLHLAGRTFLMA
jgi:hypothetical protein